LTARSLSFDVPGKGAVSALLDESGAGRWLFLYAPGAGSSLNDPFGASAASTLPAAGIDVLRFQFPYQQAKRGGPDSNPILEATWRVAIESARPVAAGRRIVAGGRSMGGRIASQVVAAGEAVDALALFAYPLHPPGKPAQAREAHLPDITVPTLFCSGTRDAFASPDELRSAAARIAGSAVHLLEAADHGFAVPKSSGRTREDVWREACDTLQEFLARIP
jgi:predicted alpha/beta-hydrolase family hydrolase